MADVISEITSLLIFAAFIFGIYKFVRFAIKEEEKEKERMAADPAFRHQKAQGESYFAVGVIVVIISAIVGAIAYYTEEANIVAFTSIPLSLMGTVTVYLILRNSARHNREIERILADQYESITNRDDQCR